VAATPSAPTAKRYTQTTMSLVYRSQPSDRIDELYSKEMRLGEETTQQHELARE